MEFFADSSGELELVRLDCWGYETVRPDCGSTFAWIEQTHAQWGGSLDARARSVENIGQEDCADAVERVSREGVVLLEETMACHSGEVHYGSTFRLK